MNRYLSDAWFHTLDDLPTVKVPKLCIPIAAVPYEDGDGKGAPRGPRRKRETMAPLPRVCALHIVPRKGR